jgi:hypothetical protein
LIGYVVHTPDLFDGRTFDSIDAGMGYPMTTAAAIDRLVHHSVILELTGISIRIEQAQSDRTAQGAISPMLSRKLWNRRGAAIDLDIHEVDLITTRPRSQLRHLAATQASKMIPGWPAGWSSTQRRRRRWCAGSSNMSASLAPSHVATWTAAMPAFLTPDH